MNLIKAVIIGIVEGLTEWLPISSTGHMIILNEFLKLDVSEAFWEFFLVAIQFGAILAVVVIFWNKLWPFKIADGKLLLRKASINIWLKVFVATLPAAIIGLLLDDWMNEHFYNYVVVAIALIAYGIWFLRLESSRKGEYKINKLKEIDYRTALLIGLFQVLALVPGTSRSGSTIIGGMMLGTSRSVAAEFTFWMAVPVMAGASLLKLMKFGFNFSGQELAILAAGSLSAFLVSLASIRFLMNYVKKHDFKLFGIYRIVLGLVVLTYFFFS